MVIARAACARFGPLTAPTGSCVSNWQLYSAMVKNAVKDSMRSIFADHSLESFEPVKVKSRGPTPRTSLDGRSRSQVSQLLALVLCQSLNLSPSSYVHISADLPGNELCRIPSHHGD